MFGIGLSWMTAAKAALVLALAVAVGLAWSHYTSLLSRVERQQQEIQTKDAALASQNEVIDTQKSAIKTWEAAAEKYQKDIADFSARQAASAAKMRLLNEELSSRPIRGRITLSPAAAQDDVDAAVARAVGRLRCATAPADSAECSGAGLAAAGSGASAPATRSGTDPPPVAGPLPRTPPRQK